MIYDAVFAGLPGAAKEAVYRKLYAMVTGTDASRKYARLSPADRCAILEILLDAKADLPAYGRQDRGK